NGRESPVPAGLSRFRSRRESTPWNPWAPRDPPFRRRGAFRRSAQSFARTALRWPSAAARSRFLSRELQVSTSWRRVFAVPPIQSLSPDSPWHPVAALPPRSSPCPERKPSRPATRCPARAATAESPARFAQVEPRLVEGGPGAPCLRRRAPPRPSPLPRRDILL